MDSRLTSCKTNAGAFLFEILLPIGLKIVNLVKIRNKSVESKVRLSNLFGLIADYKIQLIRCNFKLPNTFSHRSDSLSLWTQLQLANCAIKL